MTKIFSALRLNQRGNVALVFALMLLPLIGMVGLAVDTARAYSVKQRLQEAIDSAALVGAKNYTSGVRNQMMEDYFKTNWRADFMGTDAPDLSFTPDDVHRSMTVYAQVRMPTIFMRLFGTPSVTVGTLTASVSGQTYLEVAVALDNTSSMRTLVGGSRRVDLMKTAATNFINTLYTVNGNVEDTVEDMWVSVVPFTSMVNVGSQHTNFLVPNSTNDLLWDYPKNTTTQNAWRGCVFERSFYIESGTPYGGRDLTDASPTAEKFYPYHISPPHVEALAICNNAPPCGSGEHMCWNNACSTGGGVCPVAPPPPPPAPPPVPPPAPGCSVDGVPVSCKIMQNPIKLPLQSSMLVDVAAGCRWGNSYWSWWNSHTMFRPSFTYTTPQGRVIQHPSNGAGDAFGFNRSSSLTNNGSAYAGNNLSGASACCGGGYDAYNTLGWTYNGRWIAPWPTTGTVKLGGWGNSGCGLPIRALAGSRTDVLATINDMDVPPAPASGQPELGYSGTLINQGLVWAWRTISPNWRGFWRQQNGADIDSTLPLDYGTFGSSKAVVVMTDGLNFLPDAGATTSYAGPTYFRQVSVSVPSSDTNISPNPITFAWEASPTQWTDVDNSAYGIINRNVTDNLPAGTGGPGYGVSFCRLRQSTGFEPHLSVWGCREQDCMLRKPDGSCTRSGAGGWGPYSMQDALTGSYYDELTRRLLATCSNMRAQNIRIFFILFDIANNPQKAAALSAFNTCVGGDGAVYDASDGAALNNAFNAIAIKLRELRLRQ